MRTMRRGTVLSVGVCLLLALSGCDVFAKNGDAKALKGQAATKSSAAQSPAEQKVKADLTLKLEKIDIKSVRKLPFADLFEVVLADNSIVYTNANTEFTVFGQILNNSDMRNITQARIDELSVIDFKTLPLAQSVALVKGDGSKHLAVFEDPNCGYCKAFRKTLEQTDNVTIHTFVIDILGDASTEMAKKLLCASNPAQAWEDWMLRQVEPKNTGDCDTSVLTKNRALSEQLGVTGTPTIFLSNGKRIPGVADLATLNQMLTQAQTKP